MTTCTVSIDTSGADAVVYATVLASLPNTYRLVDKDAAVVLTSSADPSKIERLCAIGAGAVVIDHPGRLSGDDLAAIAEAADRRGCLVVPAPLYGPRFAVADDLLGNVEIDLVHSTVRGDVLRSSLVEQLSLLRIVFGSVASVRVLHSSALHYAVEATMTDHLRSHVLLDGVVDSSGGDEVSMHTLGAERRLVLRIDAGPLARPADIVVFNRDGAHSPSTLYQHAHRITLVRLHQLLTTGEGALTYSVQDLRHDVQLAAALTR